MSKNEFRLRNEEGVMAWWDDNSPVMVVHRAGEGSVIIFTSDCSPTWGRPSMGTKEFRDLWKQIIEKFVIKS